MAAGDSELIEESLTAPARSAPPWPLLNRLPALFTEAQGSHSTYRDLLRQANEELKSRFMAEEPVEDLVHARAALVDTVLRESWRAQSVCADSSWALVAVGGYGRGELHPCSDIDILLLVPAPPDEPGRAAIERFVVFLWDIGLEVGHSVRSVEECAQESAADVSVMTTLLEARLLSGNNTLVAAMRAAISPD